MKITKLCYATTLLSGALQAYGGPIRAGHDYNLQARDGTYLSLDGFQSITGRLVQHRRQLADFLDISKRDLQGSAAATKLLPVSKPRTTPAATKQPSVSKPRSTPVSTKSIPALKSQRPPVPTKTTPPSKPSAPAAPRKSEGPPVIPKPKPGPEIPQGSPFHQIESPPGVAAKIYQFPTGDGWESNVKDPKAQKMLQSMNPRGRLTVVEMQGAYTSCFGPREGFSNVRTTLNDHSKGKDTYIIINGGFFIHKDDPELRRELGGESVKDSKALIGFSVGQTTVTTNTIEPAAVHKKYYEVLQGDDRTTISSAPSLKNPVDQTSKELQYFAVDGKGQQIPNPPGSVDPFMRSDYSRLPGTGLTTVNEKNKRLATVIMPNGTKLVFAYTSERKNGVKINQLRELINTFLHQYLNSDIKQATQALNLDGGGSILIGLVGNGQARLLAQGGQNGAAPPLTLAQVKEFRDVVTMVKFKLGPATTKAGQ